MELLSYESLELPTSSQTLPRRTLLLCSINVAALSRPYLLVHHTLNATATTTATTATISVATLIVHYRAFYRSKIAARVVIAPGIRIRLSTYCCAWARAGAVDAYFQRQRRENTALFRRCIVVEFSSVSRCTHFDAPLRVRPVSALLSSRLLQQSTVRAFGDGFTRAVPTHVCFPRQRRRRYHCRRRSRRSRAQANSELLTERP